MGLRQNEEPGGERHGIYFPTGTCELGVSPVQEGERYTCKVAMAMKRGVQEQRACSHNPLQN